MHHCVGTYENAVASGRSRIFSLYRLDKQERSTLELQRNGLDKEWFVHQNKSFHNARPSEKLLSLGRALCNYINRKEAKLKI